MELENATSRAENAELKIRLEKLERLVTSKFADDGRKTPMPPQLPARANLIKS
jgi:hypothetical protein